VAVSVEAEKGTPYSKARAWTSQTQSRQVSEKRIRVGYALTSQTQSRQVSEKRIRVGYAWTSQTQSRQVSGNRIRVGYAWTSQTQSNIGQYQALKEKPTKPNQTKPI
jgi:hypothetical protein